MKTLEQTVEKLFNDEGQKIEEVWYLNDNLHREGEPAIQEWNDEGQKTKEVWLLDDKLHRQDGPAFQEWNDKGQKIRERWLLDDKLHREDGPALQWWNNKGEKTIEVWWLNGKEVSKSDVEKDDTITIDGKKFSKETVKEALKNYID